MKSLIVTLLVVVGLVATAMPAFAQTASLSVPVAVVKDADGKVVGQVVGFRERPLVMLDIDGGPGLFIARPYGLEAAEMGNGIRRVYFSGPGCTGDAFVDPVFDSGLEEMTRATFVALGPDPDVGTYRVFRSTSTVTTPIVTLSQQQPNRGCEDIVDGGSKIPAAEVIPNPLEGFHGPTLANPERVWTIVGGDRLQ